MTHWAVAERAPGRALTPSRLTGLGGGVLFSILFLYVDGFEDIEAQRNERTCPRTSGRLVEGPG